MNTDRIEKTIVLHAPRPTVWRALTIAEEFGAWFSARMTGTFTPRLINIERHLGAKHD